MLYIMRHGRTDWNERNKLQGRTDIPLNAAGRKMAEEAAAVYTTSGVLSIREMLRI